MENNRTQELLSRMNSATEAELSELIQLLELKMEDIHSNAKEICDTEMLELIEEMTPEEQMNLLGELSQMNPTEIAEPTLDLQDTTLYRTTLEQLEEAQSALAMLKNPTGKYVCLRRDYLKTYRPEYYRELTEKGSLNRHLLDISERAHDLIDNQVTRWKQADAEFQAAQERGDYMKLVGLTNNFTASAEEIALKQIVYV